MKKFVSIAAASLLIACTASAQEKRPPTQEVKAQAAHVKSSGNDLLHFRFRKAHEKHVAEAQRRNKGIAKDINGQGKPLPPPPKPSGVPAPKKPPLK